MLQQRGLIEEVGRLHLAGAEQLFGLVVEVLRVGPIALAQRHQRPRPRRLAELHDLHRRLSALADPGPAVLGAGETNGPRRRQAEHRAAADRPRLLAATAADAVDLAV